MSDEPSITVVIATLGGDSLAATIQSVNSGSIQPSEILVCIPAEDAYKVLHLQGGNTRVIKTDSRGQVAQRLFGFQNASHEVVMQLDDDMVLDEFCMERLLATLNAEGPKVAVAPALIDRKTAESVYKKPVVGKVTTGIYYWLMNGSAGYVPGCIDKSGSSIGLDPGRSEKTVHEVEWLAGGCVMHLKENLVLENFWPLPGKAYYEDVVHSSILKQAGIRLLIDSRAKCSLELFRQSSMKPDEFFRNLYRDYLGRKYFLERFSRQSIRMYVYYFGRVASYLLIRRK